VEEGETAYALREVSDDDMNRVSGKEKCRPDSQIPSGQKKRKHHLPGHRTSFRGGIDHIESIARKKRKWGGKKIRPTFRKRGDRRGGGAP